MRSFVALFDVAERADCIFILNCRRLDHAIVGMSANCFRKKKIR